MSRRYEVGVYYFPNYHVDARNEAAHGPGWTEWELVKVARPRFEGHQQPKVPLWGHEMEDDPAVFARKIDAAADHGVSYFIFDWYHYEDGPFLNGCLDRGYKGAPNNDRLKFCLMWANHTWIDIHPAKYFGEPRVLYPGEVGREAFDRITDHIIADYFSHPGYFTVDGCPYFSIYELSTLIRGLGGMEAAADALADFRRRVKAAGFPDLHLCAVVWERVILPGEEVVREPEQVLRALGFDSFTSYVWIHHAWMPHHPTTEYCVMEDLYFEYAERIVGEVSLPYYPNASMGWDSSPRFCQSDVYRTDGYPGSPMLVGNTPAAFRGALERVRGLMDRTGARLMNINAWNEWTEGSYIEPDTVSGLGYLEAIRDVFGAG